MAWIAMLTAIHTVRSFGYAIDDSFITFQYAAHFAEGRGLAFTPGETYFGSTGMGQAVQLGVLARVVSWIVGLLGGDAAPAAWVPGVAVVVSGLSIAMASAVWLRVIDRLTDAWTSRVAFLVLVACAFINWQGNSVMGHETYPFVALLILASYLATFAQRPVAAGLTLAWATAIRPDGTLFVGTLGLTLAALSMRRDGLRAAAASVRPLVIAYAAPTLAWAAFLWAWFGSPIPGTMLAKKAQVALGYWPTFTLYRAWAGVQAHLPLVVFAVVAVAGVAALRRVARPAGSSPPQLAAAAFVGVWVVFCLGLVVSYSLFRVTYWFWYVIPVHFGLLSVAVVGAHEIDAAVRRFASSSSRARVVRVGVVAAVVATAAILDIGTYGPGESLQIWLTSPNVNPHISSFDAIVTYLHREEPHGASVATLEPGSLAYKLGPDFHVIDELGLATPGVARAILDEDFDYVWRTYRPDYVIVCWEGKESMHSRPWFGDRYRLAREFDVAFWKQTVHHGPKLYVARERNPASTRESR